MFSIWIHNLKYLQNALTFILGKKQVWIGQKSWKMKKDKRNNLFGSVTNCIIFPPYESEFCLYISKYIASKKSVIQVWKQSHMQSHPTQSEIFETALKDRNIQLKFNLMSVLECWDNEFLIQWANFYSMLS